MSSPSDMSLPFDIGDDVTNLEEGAGDSQDDDNHAVGPAASLDEEEPLMSLEASTRRVSRTRRICHRATTIVLGVMLVTAILTFAGMKLKGGAVRTVTEQDVQEGIVQYFADTVVPTGIDHERLCASDVVAKACAVLNKETQEWYGNSLDADLSIVHAREIMETFMVPRETVDTLIQKIGATNLSPIGTRSAFKCMDLCVKLVNSMPAGTLPTRTNVACLYRKNGFGKKAECNVNVAPVVLDKIVFPGVFDTINGLRELPNLPPKSMSEELDRMKLKNKGESESRRADKEAMGWEGLRMLLLNFFEIFPPVGEAVDDNGRRLTDHNGRQLSQFNLENTLVLAMKAKSLCLRAIWKMNNQTIPHVFNRWYGNNFAKTREDVKMVLTGVSHMLNNVEYVYKGEFCDHIGPNTIAYVVADPLYGYDKNKQTGQFLYYMCPTYIGLSEDSKIETLLHEGAHHWHMKRDDMTYPPVNGEAILYGRRATRDTAEACCDLSGGETACEAALMNAENFCYFVAATNSLAESVSEFAKACCGEPCENPDSMIGRLSGSR